MAKKEWLYHSCLYGDLYCTIISPDAAIQCALWLTREGGDGFVVAGDNFRRLSGVITVQVVDVAAERDGDEEITWTIKERPVVDMLQHHAGRIVEGRTE